MIYLISTNRPQWAEFALEQAHKWCCKIVVLNNSPKPIPFWKVHADELFHIPQCENVSQMFNYFVEKYQGDDDIFYMDDDIEVHLNSRFVMEGYLKSGWDLVINSKFFVTCGQQTKTCVRKIKGAGAGWLASEDVWREGRFAPSTKEGVYAYMRDLVDYKGVNVKTIWTPLMNLLVHDRNDVWTEKMFNKMEGKIHDGEEQNFKYVGQHGGYNVNSGRGHGGS